MADLLLLVDEHVDSTYVTVLRSNGYDVLTVGDGYPSGTDDERLLEIARDAGRSILTNDRDFVAMARNLDHAGVIMYDQGTDARTLVTAMDRIEQKLPSGERANQLVWLNQWID